MARSVPSDTVPASTSVVMPSAAIAHTSKRYSNVLDTKLSVAIVQINAGVGALPMR